MKKYLIVVAFCTLLSSNSMQPLPSIGVVGQHTSQVASILFVSAAGATLIRDSEDLYSKRNASVMRAVGYGLLIDIIYIAYTWYVRDRIWNKTAKQDQTNNQAAPVVTKRL